MKHYKPLRCLIGWHHYTNHLTGWWCDRCGRAPSRPTAVSR